MNCTTRNVSTSLKALVLYFRPPWDDFCEETTDSSAEPVIALVQGFEMKIQCQYSDLIIKIIS